MKCAGATVLVISVVGVVVALNAAQRIEGNPELLDVRSQPADVQQVRRALPPHLIREVCPTPLDKLRPRPEAHHTPFRRAHAPTTA